MWAAAWNVVGGNCGTIVAQPYGTHAILAAGVFGIAVLCIFGR
jgi:ribosomal protein S27E